VQLLEKGWLRGCIFGFANVRFVKVCLSQRRRGEPLLRAQGHSLPQRQAMLVNSSQEEGGELGVWLRVRMLNSVVFSFENYRACDARFLA